MEKFVFFFVIFIVPAYCIDIINLPETILKIVKDNCDDNFMERHFVTYEECTKTINATTFQQEMLIGLRNNNLNRVFNKYCNKLDEIIGCANKLEERLFSCMTMNDFNAVHSTLDIFVKVKKFVCSEQGYLLERFFTDGTKCMNIHQSDILTCSKKDKKEITSETPVNLLPVKICEFAANLEKCALPPIRGCESRTAHEFIEGVVTAIGEKGNCEFFNNKFTTSTESNMDYEVHFNSRHVPNESFFSSPLNLSILMIIGASLVAALLLCVCCCCFCKRKTNK